MQLPRVRVIYAGGTIGMVPRDPEAPGSVLVPGSWDEMLQWIHPLERLPIEIDACSIERPVDSSNVSAEEWKGDSGARCRRRGER